MYQFPYAEVLDETPQSARQRERQAIERSIELLQAAEKAGVRIQGGGRGPAVRAQAVERAHRGPRQGRTTTCRNQLRADLISIGLWIMREAEQIRLEKSDNFKGIIEVSTTIRDGLL